MDFLLSRVHSMVKWYVVQCSQSAASAIWASRMKEGRRGGKDASAVRDPCEHWVPLTARWAVATNWLCSPCQLPWMTWTALEVPFGCPGTCAWDRLIQHLKHSQPDKKGHQPLFLFFSQSFTLFCYWIFPMVCFPECFGGWGWVGERRQIKQHFPL